MKSNSIVPLPGTHLCSAKCQEYIGLVNTSHVSVVNFNACRTVNINLILVLAIIPISLRNRFFSDKVGDRKNLTIIISSKNYQIVVVLNKLISCPTSFLSHCYLSWVGQPLERSALRVPTARMPCCFSCIISSGLVKRLSNKYLCSFSPRLLVRQSSIFLLSPNSYRRFTSGDGPLASYPPTNSKS